MLMVLNAKYLKILIPKLWMKKHKKNLTKELTPICARELMEGVLDATDEDGWMAKRNCTNLQNTAYSYTA